jgi:hypothetical protein
MPYPQNRRRVRSSTYRFQLRREFRVQSVIDLVPYLRELGIGAWSGCGHLMDWIPDSSRIRAANPGLYAKSIARSEGPNQLDKSEHPI